MWTADSSRSAASFCYYYDDVDSQDSTKGEVLRVINDLYSAGCLVNPPPAGTAPPPPPANNASTTRLAMTPRAPKRQTTRTLADLGQTINNLVTKTGALRDYAANVKLDVMAIGETVTLFLFDGQPREDVASWNSCPQLLAQRVFLTTKSGGYGSSRSGVAKRASITLTHALISRVEDGRLGGMGNNEVSWYLKQNLSWRVINVSSARFFYSYEVLANSGVSPMDACLIMNMCQVFWSLSSRVTSSRLQIVTSCR